MSDMKDDRQISGSSVNTSTIEIPIGSLEILNQHDTPPPTLFMQGSCILEFGLFEPEELRRIDSFDSLISFLHEKEAIRGVPDPSSIGIAHVKIVDGSGEMLYRFDNNQEETVIIEMVLGEIGNLSFRLGPTGYLIGIPPTTKLDFKNGDPPMNDHRYRLRCLDSASSTDLEISGIRIEKETIAGLIPLYFGNFRDLKSEGKELKIMIWYHERV